MEGSSSWDTLPLGLRVADVQKALGLSRFEAYRLGHLIGRRIGRNFIISKERLRRYLDETPATAEVDERSY